MRRTSCFWMAFLLLASVMLVSCDDTAKTGLVVRPEDDIMSLYLDTFGVSARICYGNVITAQCDTTAMALGEFYSERFGNTKADLLVQVAPPVGYEFPPDSLNPVPDSLILYMYYNSYFGSENAPIEISIYEINKKALEYDEIYYSNLNVSDFTDESILMGQRVITSVDQTLPDSVLDSDSYLPSFRYKFSDEQVQRFFNLSRNAYSSYEAFNEEFKGMYITTKYGASTMLYFNQISLKLFYHYDVHRDDRDTILSTSIIFPANREVRQLNHFEHGFAEVDTTGQDSILVIKSPAGIYPRVTLPIGKMRQSVRNHIGDNLFDINSAVLEAEVVYMDSSENALDMPAALMLLRESQLSTFIGDDYSPSFTDTAAVVAVYDSSSDFYQFDLSYLLTYELRDNYDGTNDEEVFVLVPCHVAYNSSGEILYATPLRQLSGLCVRSATNTTSPMRIKMIYNGF